MFHEKYYPCKTIPKNDPVKKCCMECDQINTCPEQKCAEANEWLKYR
ncbi:MAG: hypothetical protein K0Q87_5558 [Neobacillus sp.]|jgi:hypothetical protein|nr:hypothetical protein [Neobacillus sp.]